MVIDRSKVKCCVVVFDCKIVLIRLKYILGYFGKIFLNLKVLMLNMLLYDFFVIMIFMLCFRCKDEYFIVYRIFNYYINFMRLDISFYF